MKLPRLRTILLAPLGLFVLLYVFFAVKFALIDESIENVASGARPPQTIAILGASGTAGDGILKAALADPDIRKIHVISRRTTPRIDAGIESGKVQLSLHLDYLDYAAAHEQMAAVTAVYWAIGTNSLGVDEKTYGMIHVDFPLQFVTEWGRVSEKTGLTFHYISSSDISADSRMMWAREKVRAETALFALGESSGVRVIAYRPDYIGPTKEEAHLGQTLLYWFFAPVKSAVRATQIGEAMLEVTARGQEFENGDRIGTWNIIKYSDAYHRRNTQRVQE